MSDSCSYAPRFAEMVNRPQDDPFWAHARECPDCRGLLAAHALFEDPVGSGAEQEGLADDDALLARRLHEELGLGEEGAAPPAARPVPGPWRRPTTWYAMAAILLAACGLSWWTAGPNFEEASLGPAPGVLRGDQGPVDGTAYTARAARGRLQLGQPDGSAGPAVLVLLDEDLAETGRLTFSGAAADLALPTGAAPSYVQIFYLDQGDTVGRSPVIPVRKE